MPTTEHRPGLGARPAQPAPDDGDGERGDGARGSALPSRLAGRPRPFYPQQHHAGAPSGAGAPFVPRPAPHQPYPPHHHRYPAPSPYAQPAPPAYGAPPAHGHAYAAQPHLPPQFSYAAPAQGYSQPANAPPSVHGSAATASQRSSFRPTGRKKALLIGINYSGKQRLKGCVNDVKCMQYLLSTRFGFRARDTTVMTDKPCGIKGVQTLMPTRRNILAAMHELVRNAQPGDSLFFHFSGHGGQIKDVSGDEDDGYDETLIPMDWRTAGHIVDDECYDIMVRPLARGARLTAVLDACHSGTGLDLPYQHDVQYTGSGMTVNGSGGSKRPSLASGLAEVAGAFVNGGASSTVSPFLKLVKGQIRGTKKKRRAPPPEPDWNAGEVLLFSGCTDDQTSADTTRLSGGTVTGAMTYALIEAIEHSTVGDWHNYSYKKLLHTMRQKLLAARMTQTPQFSSSHPFDTNSRFIV